MQGSATYNDMLQRFDELLLLELDSPTIVNESSARFSIYLSIYLSSTAPLSRRASTSCSTPLTHSSSSSTAMPPSSHSSDSR